ncbi:1-acyl-sn-glycerol-3-phosphate acyltransferase [Hyphomicrobium sulfonivorans]|uniref:1-acyl-sn-glycerol-3-phosphate acyltransferase n=1 Tax=Hyphomicrobium sulfonivorans TaxID=121290 RepID=A0A120CTA3_HYPSL|nr:lysophospholipid acyltransferase family protein [Hyphomicrobium sulfonivorans]KWT64345.1 1-acyl-sn-glycerol-3-phosphate acyltransferase [Hyphomicrobium sulfonivorans]
MSTIIYIRSLIFAALFYVGTAVFVIGGFPLMFGPRRWAMAGLKCHARFSLWLLRWIAGIRMEVRGRERLPQAPYLVAAKHQSAWDTFALIPIFNDPAMVMKWELTLIPFYGWFSRKFEHIFVRRDRGPAALRRLIADAKDRAAAGREVLIFPEGTRRAPGAQPDYKSGAVALYEGLDLPCVPVALNSGLYWPRRQLTRYPGTIIVEILDPIPAGLSRAAFRTELQSRIEAASNRLIVEASRSANPPPIPADVLERAEAATPG